MAGGPLRPASACRPLRAARRPHAAQGSSTKPPRSAPRRAGPTGSGCAPSQAARCRGGPVAPGGPLRAAARRADRAGNRPCAGEPWRWPGRSAPGGAREARRRGGPKWRVRAKRVGKPAREARKLHREALSGQTPKQQLNTWVCASAMARGNAHFHAGCATSRNRHPVASLFRSEPSKEGPLPGTTWGGWVCPIAPRSKRRRRQHRAPLPQCGPRFSQHTDRRQADQTADLARKESGKQANEFASAGPESLRLQTPAVQLRCRECSCGTTIVAASGHTS